MKPVDILKKYILPNLPYLMFLWIFAKIGEAVRLAPGYDASAKLLGLSQGFTIAFQSFMPGAAIDYLIGLCGAVLIRIIVYVKGKNAKKYRKNVEYGSARWGTKADITPFMDPKPENNIILTQTEGLMMSGRPKNPAYARNKNVLVVGGSGSGKTRFFIKPNLMQLHSSYVVTDPKGTVLVECGKLLSRGAPKIGKDGKPVRNKKGKIVCEPYRIKVFNTINFKKSMHYNPFAYIHCEKDILKLVTVLIANTKGEGKAGDDFWVKAETLLYTALIGYIYYEAPKNEQNFTTLVEMINAMEVREDDETFKNAVDLLFDALEQKDPDHFSVRQYKKYKLAAGETTTEEEDYEYYILNVKLRNKGLNSVISNSGLSEDDMERYRILLQTRGNRPDIFGNDIYATPGGEYTDYDIPGEALTDTRFANMIREAEKYLGYPYVWGGSSPSTSFDCSGFVSYVINHCGNGWSVGRLTANGLMGVCDIIPKSSAKPGDLIFFQGTYDTSGASHVGIYVGNGMMIHCGNPISYASIESNYWQQHFYCFGRIRN